jgi:hypothetical protein
MFEHIAMAVRIVMKYGLIDIHIDTSPEDSNRYLSRKHKQPSIATRSTKDLIDLLPHVTCELFAAAVDTSSEQDTS